jgi:hypothetical protein
MSLEQRLETKEGIESYIREKFGKDGDTAVAIMYAESSASTTDVNWNDHHKGCDGSSGLFQIACLHAPIEEMKKPQQNIEVAFRVYKQAGNSFSPWTTWVDGKYKKYL